MVIWVCLFHCLHENYPHTLIKITCIHYRGLRDKCKEEEGPKTYNEEHEGTRGPGKSHIIAITAKQ